jgi:hypothetical protein
MQPSIQMLAQGEIEQYRCNLSQDFACGGSFLNPSPTLGRKFMHDRETAGQRNRCGHHVTCHLDEATFQSVKPGKSVRISTRTMVLCWCK